MISVRPHLLLLSVLQLTWGGIGLLLGFSTLLLTAGAVAIGLSDAGDQIQASLTATAFAVCALALLVGGLANAWAGLAIHRHRNGGRTLALALALPNLFVLPFGTALGIYALWVLLNEETRTLFGVSE